MGEPVLLTVHEFAERLNMKPGTVYNWLSKRKLASVKVSRRMVRIPLTEIDRLMGRLVPAKPTSSSDAKGNPV